MCQDVYKRQDEIVAEPHKGNASQQTELDYQLAWARTCLLYTSGFNRMVADALDGKIDLILTKSLSRFARNTVDALTTIRS